MVVVCSFLFIIHKRLNSVIIKKFILFFSFLFIAFCNMKGQPLPNTDLQWSRLLNPAGKQLVFGNPEVENHALDVSLSPDGR